ncbi:MAG TPA: ABC transporter permease subunit [Candidatus Eisenbacteria bacterium]|nr:ABC transporter permease subunit [Candidatus Eisenbacteria bacterium]
MTGTFAIAKNTVREVVRQRMVLVLALFGVGLLAASQILSPLALGEGRKVVTDFGLAGSSMLATLLAVVLGSTLLHKELERRTIYAVMAKPIRRSDFLLGKFLGLWLTAAGLVAGMTAMVLALLAAVYGESAWLLLGSMALTVVELGVITAIVVFYSSFTTPALTALFTAATIVAGHFADDLLYFASQGASPVLARTTEAIYWLLPHLAVFNARGQVVHGIPVEPERLAFAGTYGLLYMLALLVAAGAIFERREFR